MDEELRNLKHLIWDLRDILDFAEVSDGFARQWALRELMAEAEPWLEDWDRFPDD